MQWVFESPVVIGPLPDLPLPVLPPLGLPLGLPPGRALGLPPGRTLGLLPGLPLGLPLLALLNLDAFFTIADEPGITEIADESGIANVFSAVMPARAGA